MVKMLRIYFEGDDKLKPGFRAFFKEIYDVAKSKCYIRLINTNGTPVDDFKRGLRANPNDWNVLLLDSEEPLQGCARSKQIDPQYHDRVFWMVEAMESWFLADLKALCAFYHNHVQESALKGNPKVEEIPKIDVMSRMKKASGGNYHKTKHAPKLLELIDPALVREAAPNCERMFQSILAMLSGAS
jgi:hypothetical protein